MGLLTSGVQGSLSSLNHSIYSEAQRPARFLCASWQILRENELEGGIGYFWSEIWDGIQVGGFTLREIIGGWLSVRALAPPRRFSSRRFDDGLDC